MVQITNHQSQNNISKATNHKSQVRSHKTKEMEVDDQKAKIKVKNQKWQIKSQTSKAKNERHMSQVTSQIFKSKVKGHKILQLNLSLLLLLSYKDRKPQESFMQHLSFS